MDDINKSEMLLDIEEYKKEGINKSLQERFIVPPFSVLDTKQGYWQERRRLWLSLGIKSEIGRGDNLLQHSKYTVEFNYYSNKNKYGKCLPSGFDESKYGKKMKQGTSIFDPVLTELLYKWFCIKGGSILDPFAGGSVRGIVANKLGYKYTGIELNSVQVEANNKQAMDILGNNKDNVIWYCGDSNNMLNILPQNNLYDFLFSCPPYYNLEVYSDLPEDLSNMPYEKFLDIYYNIIKLSYDKLHNDRFACFVVGEVRDKDGSYINFVGDTIKSFLKAGFLYYNEIILVNVCGTLPIRISKQFNSGRKIGKQHQNVLVFYKGNMDNIKNNYEKL